MVNIPYQDLMRNPRRQGKPADEEIPKRPQLRPIEWIASSKADLSALPPEVKASFGLRLFELQQGKTPLDMRPLMQFGTGVYELRDTFDKKCLSGCVCRESQEGSLCVARLYEEIEIRH